MHERGFQMRFLNHFMEDTTVKCLDAALFRGQSTSLTNFDVFSSYILISSGFILAILILIFELNYKPLNYRHSK